MNNVILNFVENYTDYRFRVNVKEYLIRSEDPEFVARLNNSLKYSIDYFEELPPGKKIPISLGAEKSLGAEAQKLLREFLENS